LDCPVFPKLTKRGEIRECAKPVKPFNVKYSVLWGITQDGGWAFLPNGRGYKFVAETGVFEGLQDFPSTELFTYVCWGYAVCR
jgi:hypothetical protein